ncbi:phasin family protein [Marinobacterium marinum]|uniref:Phasin family protein n=1 Tax=Marinobacterium marinum TaxID=2756129 RepID=A0A7W2AC49_9GAMM|nr:phasin family protein [Marinobacterium marinum]MBA4502109.1 phasin family protein [Marinobacterium marinum]
MYDNMLKDMQDKMKPMTQLVELNRKAAEKIFSLQSELFTTSVNASLAQFKALAEVKEPKEAFELQMSFIKEQEAKWSDTAEQELAALNEVREEFTSLLEQGLESMNDLPCFDLSKFELPAFDMKGFDLSGWMPKAEETAKAEASKAESKPAVKQPVRKASSAASSAASA